MAKKKAAKKKTTRKKAETKPSFPYTTKPSSLRRILKEIPQKPKPPKYDKELLQGWGYKDANDYSIIRVFKTIGMLNANNEPSEIYTDFMHLQTGASALAPKLREVYAPLFNASHEPWNESAEALQNLFHIHSGGSEKCIEQQIQTFKALAENTSFEGAAPAAAATAAAPVAAAATPGNPPIAAQTGAPAVNINVHIHLPENKSRRDYECIIEDIGRYIFGRDDRGTRND